MVLEDEYGKVVSKNLKRLLFEAEKSQSDLARDLGIPKTTYWVFGLSRYRSICSKLRKMGLA